MVADRQGLKKFNVGSWKNKPGTQTDQGWGKSRDLIFSTNGKKSWDLTNPVAQL